MGLGKLLNRSTQYVATNTVTGDSQTFTVVDNIGPDWPSSSYRQGMTIPGAWRGATLLADLVGAMPWDAYRQQVGRPPTLIEPAPPLLDQPNPPEPRFNTFAAWMLDLLWHGNAIGLIAARNRDNWPTAVYPVPATAVGVRRVIAPGMSNLPVGSIEYHVGTMRDLGVHDLIHVKGPHAPGELRGMGILETHMNTLDLAVELNRQARKVSKNAVPPGVLKTDSPDTGSGHLKQAKKAWMESMRDGSIAALGFGTDFKPLAWNPEQMQMVESRRFNLQELELIFGLPRGMLGGETSSRTYANISQEDVQLLKFTLRGWIERFEETLSGHFPRGTVVKGNIDDTLRADTLTRYQAHQIALGGKAWMDEDEVRTIEGRAPLTPDQRSRLTPAPPPVTPTEPTEDES